MTRRPALALTALVLTLTACSSPDKAPEPSEVVEATPAAFQPALPDEQALRFIREDITYFHDIDNGTVAELAEGFCEIWDTTPPDDDQRASVEILAMLLDVGMDAREAGAWPAYATGWKCPEHLDRASLI